MDMAATLRGSAPQGGAGNHKVPDVLVEGGDSLAGCPGLQGIYLGRVPAQLRFNRGLQCVLFWRMMS